MGDNKEGQLGLGHVKDNFQGPALVKALSDKFVMVRRCCTITENQLIPKSI